MRMNGVRREKMENVESEMGAMRRIALDACGGNIEEGRGGRSVDTPPACTPVGSGQFTHRTEAHPILVFTIRCPTLSAYSIRSSCTRYLETTKLPWYLSFQAAAVVAQSIRAEGGQSR